MHEKNQILEDANKALFNANQTINEASDPNKAYGDQGSKVGYGNVIRDYLGPITAMVDLAFKGATKPMISETVQVDFLLPQSTTSNSDVVLGAGPVDSAMLTQAMTFGYGKRWRKDSILKEKLMVRLNQMKLMNKKFESDGQFAHPIAQMRKNLLNIELRDLNSRLWSAIPVSGFGLVGLKYQHGKLNAGSTTVAGVSGASNNAPTTGTADNSFEKTYWTDDASGKLAFASNVFERVTRATEYGANHFVLIVPRGAGLVAKNALINYQQQNTQSTIMFGISNSGIPTGAGEYLSPFGNRNRFYVNDYIDVLEIPGPSAGECMLYADEANGNYTVENYELVSNTAPVGYKTIVSADNSTLKALAGFGDYEDAIFTPLYNSANYETLYTSIQWTGQVAFLGVALSTLYTQVNFLKTSTIEMLPDTNGTQNIVDIMS